MMQELGSFLSLHPEAAAVVVMGAFGFLFYLWLSHVKACNQTTARLETKLDGMARDLNQVIGYVKAQQEDGK